jgi:hypothetical protein
MICSSEGHNTKHSFIKIACIFTHARYNVLHFWSNEHPQLLMGTKIGWICNILAMVHWYCQEVWNNTEVLSEQIILRSQNDKVNQHYHVKITCRLMQLVKLSTKNCILAFSNLAVHVTGSGFRSWFTCQACWQGLHGYPQSLYAQLGYSAP